MARSPSEHCKGRSMTANGRDMAMLIIGIVAIILVVALFTGVAAFCVEVDRLEQDAVFSVCVNVEQPISHDEPISGHANLPTVPAAARERGD